MTILKVLIAEKGTIATSAGEKFTGLQTEERIELSHLHGWEHQVMGAFEHQAESCQMAGQTQPSRKGYYSAS
jgi:hypothetical protein